MSKLDQFLKKNRLCFLFFYNIVNINKPKVFDYLLYW